MVLTALAYTTALELEHAFPQEVSHPLPQPVLQITAQLFVQEPFVHLSAVEPSGFSSLLLYIKSPPFQIFYDIK